MTHPTPFCSYPHCTEPATRVYLTSRHGSPVLARYARCLKHPMPERTAHPLTPRKARRKQEGRKRRRPARYVLDGRRVGFRTACEALLERTPGMTRSELVEAMAAISDAPWDQVRNAVYYGVRYIADVEVVGGRLYPEDPTP